MPAGHTNHAVPREVQHRARNPRPSRAREQPYEVQIQDLRQAVAHQRNSYNRYYENRYYGGHGNHPGYRGVSGGNSGGSIERDYNHQSSHFMQGLSGTYYPGYGQCRLCGKCENENDIDYFSSLILLPSVVSWGGGVVQRGTVSFGMYGSSTNPTTES